jgi:hypothetical protein
MAKWRFDRPGRWEYPTFGFVASHGDVLAADLPPDHYWTEVDPALDETVDRTHIGWLTPDFDQTPEGFVLAYSRDVDAFIPMDPIVVAGGAGYDDTDIRQTITTHVESPTPHPAYDEDIPSLSLLFENGLI